MPDVALDDHVREFVLKVLESYRAAGREDAVIEFVMAFLRSYQSGDRWPPTRLRWLMRDVLKTSPKANWSREVPKAEVIERLCNRSTKRFLTMVRDKKLIVKPVLKGKGDGKWARFIKVHRASPAVQGHAVLLDWFDEA
jgi:hypothetical protein